MYNNINPKYKTFLFFLIKFTVIVGSLYFIYTKTVNNSQLNFDELLKQLNSVLFKSNWTILILLSFTFFNWLFEIWKWKILVSYVKNITFQEASKQSLASHTISLLTPNRIGEYGGKVIYFPKDKGKILFLNLIGNLYQLSITILFGVAGTIYFMNTYNIEIEPRRLRKFAYLIGFVILLFISKKNRLLKVGTFFKIDKIKSFFKSMRRKTHLTILSFSIIRYLIFSHQFYFSLILFGVDYDYTNLMLLIFTMYFVASSIPSITLFDWAIKGSVAIYIFSFINITEVIVFTIILLMWILNFALPSMVGIFYVLKFKTPYKI
jgi:hypothetical protein|tara:strand:+ start:3550 stop:4512 length:963 start_codon:yes stop_codon:yes gene_type:complete